MKTLGLLAWSVLSRFHFYLLTETFHDEVSSIVFSSLSTISLSTSVVGMAMENPNDSILTNIMAEESPCPSPTEPSKPNNNNNNNSNNYTTIFLTKQTILLLILL